MRKGNITADSYPPDQPTAIILGYAQSRMARVLLHDAAQA